jgi:alkanesulfonate monooxygenase
VVTPPEIGWFGALCDDDYEFLGLPDEGLASSWEHCRAITIAAESYGYDTILLPSGYGLGLDSVAFAAAVATQTEHINLLLAVRMGELVVPQLARQLTTIDQIAGGRLMLNIISSNVPGEALPGPDRYGRTLEFMAALRTLMSGQPLDMSGRFVDLVIDPPRVSMDSGRCPPFYFGGLSEEAKACAAAGADVYLMWPDTPAAVAAVVDDMKDRAEALGRTLRFGWRSHVIVRETEDEARAAARRLLSRLDPATGRSIRDRSLDSASTGVARQAELRDEADGEGYVGRHLWTGIGQARSGAGAAIVGDPDQVLAALVELREAGVDSFILSGYPHLHECDLFGRHVLARMDHAPLAVPIQPVAGP